VGFWPSSIGAQEEVRQLIRKSYGVWGGVLLLGVGVLICGGIAKSKTSASEESAFDEKVVSYVREKYGIPTVIKLAVDPFAPSPFHGFLTSTLTSDDGKDSKKTKVFLTNDRHYLILGQLYPAGPDPKQEMVQHIREQYKEKIPETTSLTVGPFRKSAFTNMLVATVTAESGKIKEDQDFYMTADNHILVLGSILDLGLDLRRVALRTMVTANQPSQGPEHAPVTIVEYADLECPTCARLHDFFENQLLPRYGNRVRIIFKELPLVQIHDWSETAAIANECVFQIKPEAYAPYRSLIFRSQAAINAANVRDILLENADRVGVDRVTLAGCLDSKASLPLIEADVREATQLAVHQTPTCYINGRVVVGMLTPEIFFQAVDQALKEAK
jgi:protein-disulfide isomerase